MAKKKSEAAEPGITRISVAGFKSIRDKISIDIRPLTILAGANSSGKSSIMQPVLMLKQTMEVSFDPGPLLLNGPHVNFTEAKQFFFQSGKSAKNKQFSVGLKNKDGQENTWFYSYTNQSGLKIDKLIYESNVLSEKREFRLNMSHEEIMDNIPLLRGILGSLFLNQTGVMEVVRNKHLLVARTTNNEFGGGFLPHSPFDVAESPIQSIIHLPGLRGNPQRIYQVTAVGEIFPGLFNDYVASVIHHWQKNSDKTRMEKLNRWLMELGLTWKVQTKQLNDTQIEIWVGRLAKKGDDQDLVNIADVGLGVSQVLPVLVALLVARPGQTVYLEQPELHLHPRAQMVLAKILAEAAQMGATVVVETHSELLLRGIQTQVAAGLLDRKLVKLHWFERNPEDGATQITSSDLNEKGAFDTKWPEDFSSVAMDSANAFLNAVTRGIFYQ